MPTVTQEEAIANLARLIDDIAERGGEIVVTRDQIAIARIVSVADPVISDAKQVRLSREERLALLQQAPPVSEPGPTPTGESLRRENIYPDRA